jgi:hypothetical protein
MLEIRVSGGYNSTAVYHNWVLQRFIEIAMPLIAFAGLHLPKLGLTKLRHVPTVAGDGIKFSIFVYPYLVLLNLCSETAHKQERLPE